MSLTTDVLRCAAPGQPVVVWVWDPAHARWRFRGPWVPAGWAFALPPTEPLPLIAVETTQHTWIVPVTDGDRWHWAAVPIRPHRLPVVVSARAATP